MKIGVSSYSFSQYIKQGKLDDISVIKKAADMGFSAIEFIGLTKETKEENEKLAEEIKAEAKKNNIELSAYVVGGNLLQESDELLEKEVERLKSEIDIANILGVKLFRYDVCYKLPQGMCFDKAVDVVKGPMRELAEYGMKYGIKTMIENHGQAFQDSDRVQKIYNAVDHENFALLVDIGNFMCADEESYKSVSKVANLAAHVHLKDFVKKDYYSNQSKDNHFMTRGCNYLMGVAVGEGEARTAQCVQILKNAGYDGYLDIEFEGPKDCIEELEKGLAFAKSII